MADQDGTGIRLGSVAGTPVILQRSWFLIAAVLTLFVGPQVRDRVPGIGDGAAYLAGFAFAGLLLGSVFLHELAHALTARAVGTPPTDIVLDLWGGHTAFSRELPTAGRSVLVAAVGPATNALIAVGALAILVLAGRDVAEPAGVGDILVSLLWTSNVFVAVLNALPGLPLDGGRVLEGAVWAVTGSRTTGTLLAGWCGRVVAAGVVSWWLLRPLAAGGRPSVVSVVWVLGVAWMLWQGASQAIRYAGWQRVAASVTAGGLMTPAVTVSSTATVAEARAAADRDGADRAPVCVVVLDVYGRPAGVLDDEALGSVPPQRAGLVGVSAVARPLPAVMLDPGLAGEELVARLQATPAGEYPVADGSRVVGVLSWRVVAAAVQRR